jgi:hypothetical protein
MSGERRFTDALQAGGWHANIDLSHVPEDICGIININNIHPSNAIALAERAEEIHKAQPEIPFMLILGHLVIHSVQIHTLRKYVDEWIDSGRKDGVDSPWERTVPSDAVRIFNIGYTTSSHLSANGRPTASYVFRGWSPGADDLEKHGSLAATSRFMVLMDSPDRERVSRCDRCRTYFARQRVPKKGIVIKHGSFCDSCEGRGRVQGTVRSRERRKNELVALAATFWEQCPQAKLQERSDWVAKKMTSKLPEGEAPITKNWVTHNRVDIEAAVSSPFQKES